MSAGTTTAASNRIVVDPVTRIEGHLRIEAEVKDGKIVADGFKSILLTDDQVSRLFDSKITLVQANGWYQALPG